MNTYKYRMPVSGKTGKQTEIMVGQLEDRLKNSPDCIDSYCIFPSDSTILDHITIEADIASYEPDNICATAINIYTYTKVYAGMENELADCVRENLNELAKAGKTPTIEITGEIQFEGMQGKIPDKLYRLSQEKHTESILNDGLIPQTGGRGYKSDQKYVYLMEAEDIPVWISVLPNLTDPVIFEIDTAGLDGIEPGRYFTDRTYVKGYGEYRTENAIPPDHIRKIELTEEDVQHLTNAIESYFHNMTDDEIPELKRGWSRAFNMRTETENWNDREVGDSLEESLRQMTLEDYGLKL